MDDIELIERFPDVDDYCRLRLAAGMSPRSVDAARRGLPNTLFGVRLQQKGRIVGMGRIIGDGGCFFTVADIAVEPAYQGRGLGRRIMTALDAWLRANAPATACVSLVADGDAKYLYAKFGFVETTPAAVNMEYVVAPKP
jgi:GNAT superfamily N-acetyltransferase